MQHFWHEVDRYIDTTCRTQACLIAETNPKGIQSHAIYSKQKTKLKKQSQKFHSQIHIEKIS